MDKSKKYGINTRAIHTHKKFQLPTGDVMPPLHMSTTFEHALRHDSQERIQQRYCNKNTRMRTQPFRHDLMGPKNKNKKGINAPRIVALTSSSSSDFASFLLLKGLPTRDPAPKE